MAAPDPQKIATDQRWEDFRHATDELVSPGRCGPLGAEHRQDHGARLYGYKRS
jgi:hypothetical protein